MTLTVFGVRTDKFKYIRYYGIWDTNELYDLEHDPNESANLINNPEYKPVADKMTKELFKWLNETKGMQIPLKEINNRQAFGDYRHRRGVKSPAADKP